MNLARSHVAVGECYAATDSQHNMSADHGARRGILSSAQRVGWTAHAHAGAVEHVGVDHRRPHVLVSQELLHGANVVPLIEQVRRERMPQRVARGPLLEPRSQLPKNMLPASDVASSW